METKMTPDERQLISGLFDRMRSNGTVEKDREAESLINQAVRQTPDAAYLLVQSVLAQEHYLQQAASRIEDLEARMRELEDDVAQRQAPAQSTGGGSFLGGLFGGGQNAPQQSARSSGSVPSFGGRGSSPQNGQGRSPWNQQARGSAGAGPGGSPWGGQQQAAGARGGGFMASALTTAAGVAGGMLAANALSNIFGGSSASAAHTPGSSGSTESATSADHQAQLDAQQDAQQDQELANEQYASYDDSSDADADWGDADDSDF
jgi:hypothetical protein